MLNRSLYPLIIVITALLISGCAKDHEFTNDAQKDYDAAKALVNGGSYNLAANNLEHFSSSYPYSKLATPAELLRIFAAYKGREFILSETLSQAFVERHPRHPNVDYAKYMLAMSHYRERGDAENDPSHTVAAIDAFNSLITDHPNSSYASAAKTYLQSLHNSLGEHELSVGKFYYENGRYVAAANRFQNMIREYQTTPSIEEALYMLTMSYHKMGLEQDAKETAILLHHNYPNSSWSSKVSRFL